MKIRIKGNSLRLRLTKSEVDYFGVTGFVEDKIEFGNTELIYSMQSSVGHNEIRANFDGSKITVQIPDTVKKEWVETEKVSLENKMDIGRGKQLLILIEKDFVCLDNTVEDQSDNYPNPNSVC